MQPDNHQSTHRNLQASWTDSGMWVGSTSGSLPLVPRNVRSVRGSDVLVYEHCGLVTCAIIQENLSLENLSTQFTLPYHFIWNQNVHNLLRGLRGMLLYYQGRIMVIVKAQGNFALAMSVFPKCGNYVEVLSLKNPHGFYVQQITGER